MVRINISHSPLSVSLFDDDGSDRVNHYSGKIEDILNQLVTDVYDIGWRDGNTPADELHREITNYSRDTIDNGPSLEEADASK